MNFASMPPHARVWVYMADREFSDSEQQELTGFFETFVRQWTAHNKELKASMDLLYKRFVVVMVDEDVNAVSGCGIDKSVNFLKAIEGDFHVSFFNRLLVGYKQGENVQVVQQSQVASLLEQGTINADTLVFNPLVQTRIEFDSAWLSPLKNTWLKRHLTHAGV